MEVKHSNSCLVTFTTDPSDDGVAVNTRFYPLGTIGCVVVYPTGIVGVYVASTRKRGDRFNVVAGDLKGQRLMALVGSALKAATRAILARAGKWDKVRVPPLWVACDPRVDIDRYVNIRALARWSASTDPSVWMETLERTVVKWGGMTLMPLDLYEGFVDHAQVYEDMEGLHENGEPLVQMAPTRWLEDMGMGEQNLRFTQKKG